MLSAAASLPTEAGEPRHGNLKGSSTAFVLPAETDMSARSSTRSSRSCDSEVQEDLDFQHVLAYVNRRSHRQERSIDSIQQVGVGHISVLLDRLLGRLEDFQSGVTGPWACSTCSKVNEPLCSACIACKHTRDEVGGARTSNSSREQGVRSVWMRLIAMDLKYADLLQLPCPASIQSEADIARALRGGDRAVLLDLLDYLLRCDERVDELRLARGAAAAAALSSSSSGRAVSRMPAPWQQSSRALLCGAASPLARGLGGSGSSSGSDSDSGDSSSDARSPERCRRHRGAAASASDRGSQEPPLQAASPTAHGGDAHAMTLSRSCAALLSAPPPAAPPALGGESSSERTSSDEWRTGLVDKLVQRAVQKVYGAGSGDSGGGGDGSSGGARKAAPFGGMAPMSSMAMSRRLSVKTPPRPRGGIGGDGGGGNARAFKVLGISVGGGVDGGSAERSAAAHTVVAAAGVAELKAGGAVPLNSGTPGGGVLATAASAAVEVPEALADSDGVLMSTGGSGDAARSSGGDVQRSSSGDGVNSSGGTSESQQPTVITPSASPLLLPQQQDAVASVLVTARQHSDNTGSEGSGSDSGSPHSAGGSSNTEAMQMDSSAADAADLSKEHATPVRSGSRPDAPIIAAPTSQQQQAAAEAVFMTPVTARQQRSGAASSGSSSAKAADVRGSTVAGDARGLETPHSISSSLGDSTASGSASKALRVLGITGIDASTALETPSIGGGSVGGGSSSVGSSSSNAKALKMLGISASELGDTLPPSPPLFDGGGAAAASSPRRRRMWQRNSAPGSGSSGARDREPGTSNSGVAAAAAAAAAAAVAAGSSGLGARAQLAMWRARGRRRSKDKAGDGAAAAAAPAAAGEAGGGVLLPTVGASSAAAGGAAPPSEPALAPASAAHGAAPAAAVPAAATGHLVGSGAQAGDASTARGLDSAPPQPPSAAVTQLLPPRDGRHAHVADKLAAADASKTLAVASAVSTLPPFGGGSRDCWQPPAASAAAAAGAEPQPLSNAVLPTPTLQMPAKSPPSSPPSVLLPLSAASPSPSTELQPSTASLPALAEPEAAAASPAAPPDATLVQAAGLDSRGPTSADPPASNPETLPMSQPVTVDLPAGGRSLQASSLASDLGSVPGQLLTQFSSADLSSEGHSYHTIASTMELPLPPSPARQVAASPAPGGSSGSTAGKAAASSCTGSISDTPAAAADATAAGTAAGWGGQPPELPAAAAGAAEPPLLLEPRLLRANASAMELSGWQPPRPQRQATSPTVGAPPVSLRSGGDGADAGCGSDGGSSVAALEQVATAVLDRDVCDVAPGELGAAAAPAAASAAASGDPYAELSTDGAAAAGAEPSAAQRGKQAPLPLCPLPPAGAGNAKALRTLGISAASASGSPIVGRTAGGSNAKALKMLGISGGDAGAAGGSTRMGPRVAMASPLRGGFTTRDNVDEMPAYYRQRLMASQSPRPLPPQARSAAAAGGSGGGGGALGRAKSRLSTALPSRSFELGSGAGIRAFGGRRRTAASSSSGSGGRGNSGAQPPSRAAAAARSGGGDAEEAARETRSYSSDAEGGRERSGSRSRARNAVAALNLRLPPPTARRQSAAAAAAAAAKLAAAAPQEAPAHTVSSLTTEEEALSVAVAARLQEQQAAPVAAARDFDLQSPPRSRQHSSQRAGASPASSSRAAVRAAAAAALLRAPAEERLDAALLRALVAPVSQPDTNGDNEESGADCVLAAALAVLCDVRAVPAAAAACRAWRAALAPRALQLLQRAAALRGVPEPLRAPLYRHFAFAAAPTPAQRAAAAAVTGGSASGGPSDAAAAAAAAPSPWLPGCVSQDAFAQLVRAGEAAAEAAFVARDVPRAFGRSTHRRARSAGGGGGAVSVLGGWGAGRSALEEQLRQWEEEEQANAAFERVPLGLRRRALANVLYAAIGASSAEGYCQGQDRVVGHLMRVCSAEPLDDGSGGGAWDDDTIDDDADDGDNAPPGSPPPSLWSLLWEAPVVAPAAAPAPIVLHPEPGGARAGRPIYELYASLFEAYRLKELYAVETAGIMVCVEVFLHLMAVKLPALAAHLADLDFSLDLVVFGWFQTLLCAVPLPHATRARVFDWWLTSGELSVFFRAGLALLELNEDALLCREFEGVAHFLATFPDADGVDAVRVMRAAHALPLPAAELMMMEEAVRHVHRDQVALPQQLLLRPGPFYNVTSLADASAGVC